MKNLIKSFALVAFLFCSTLNYAQNGNRENLIETKVYKLYKPDNTGAVLLLFGGFPETAETIENEFPITELALNRNVAVAYLNYNRKLWLEDDDKTKLAQSIQKLMNENELPSDKIYIGGLSSGGSIALLIGNHLSNNSEYNMEPSGIFVVDSPVDLAALYRIAEQNIERNFSQATVGESSFMHNYFNSQLGNPNDEIAPYEKYSVFTYETKNIQNLNDLMNTKLRFYTEPDKTWWKENMGVDYEQMNAYHIKRLSDHLVSRGYSDVEFITTEDKGYRANGGRHLHSWSIVDKENYFNG